MNPLQFLTPPFQWLLEHMTTFFLAVGPLRAIGAFGLAVIALTVIIRAVLFPVFNWQLRTSRRIQREQRMIAPQLQALRKKYKGEPQKLSAEMNKLYREHGMSPFSSLSGCLPLLLQIPVLYGLYGAINNVTRNFLGNGDKSFLWIPDVSKAVVVNGNFGGILSNIPGLILPLLAAVFTFAQSRMMMPPPRPDMTDQERSMQRVTQQMSIIFPFMIFFLGCILPQGLAIYWVTGTMFMVLQQYIVVGWGGLKVPEWFPGAGRVTQLSFPATVPSPALVSANGDQKTPRTAGRVTASAAEDGEASTTAAAKQPALTSAAQRRQHMSARARARDRAQRRRRR